MPNDESVAYWMSFLPEVSYGDLREYASFLKAGREAEEVGKLRRAEMAYRQAAEYAQDMYGDDGELLSNALLLLSNVLSAQGRKKESDFANRRASKILACDCC